jgi:hypothetical protein
MKDLVDFDGKKQTVEQRLGVFKTYQNEQVWIPRTLSSFFNCEFKNNIIAGNLIHASYVVNLGLKNVKIIDTNTRKDEVNDIVQDFIDNGSHYVSTKLSHGQWASTYYNCVEIIYAFEVYWDVIEDVHFINNRCDDGEEFFQISQPNSVEHLELNRLWFIGNKGPDVNYIMSLKLFEAAYYFKNCRFEENEAYYNIIYSTANAKGSI